MRFFLFRYFLSVIIACFVSVHVCGGQVVDSIRSVQNLAEIEIVERSAVDNFTSGVLLQEIGQDDIARLGIVTVADAIKNMAGVQVHDYGGVGGLKTVSIRGMGAKHTSVSYDGIAIADVQSGLVDVGRFTLDNVEVLSLTMGQGNELLRSAKAYASAGEINLATRKPLGNRLALKANAGDFGAVGVSLLRERVFGKRWSYSAFVSGQCVDGDYPFELENGAFIETERRENSDVKSFTAEGNLFGNFGAGGNLSVKVYYYDSERGLPGAVNLYNKIGKERLWDDNLFVQSLYKLQLSDNVTMRTAVKYNYSFSRYRDENKNYSAGYKEERNTQHEYYGSLGFSYDVFKGFSLALSSDLTRSSLRNNFSDGKEPRRLNSQTVLAAQYERSNFIATASLLATLIDDDVEDGGEAAKNKSRLSPAVSFSWQPISSLPLRLRASYKDVYRVPTFTDLYYERMGNTGLKPERASQYSTGVSFSGSVGDKGEIYVSVDGYYNRVKDKIVALPTLYIWRMKNYGEVEVKGVDVTASLRYPLLNNMELLFDMAYSYSHSVDKSDREAKNYGHQIPYTPRHTGNVSLTWNNPWLNISYMLTAVGKRYMLPQNIKDNEIASYVEHSLSANREFEFGKKAILRLQGELLNFTNVNYDIIRYYPMPGRQWRISACLIF